MFIRFCKILGFFIGLFVCSMMMLLGVMWRLLRVVLLFVKVILVIVKFWLNGGIEKSFISCSFRFFNVWLDDIFNFFFFCIF